MSRQTVETAAGAADEPQKTGGETTPPVTAERKRRRRRSADAFLRPVYPISAILSSATAEETQKARLLVNELLGYWLGHESKAALARRLSMPPIRVWQLSQRAMTGMVAAMLRPPQGRRGAMPRIDPETKALRKRVAELEAETSLQRRLIELLRTMPGNERRELPRDQVPKEESDASAPRKRKSSKPKTSMERGTSGAGPGALPGPGPTLG